jgi:hypothetical protein
MSVVLNARQAAGHACVRCGLDYGQPAGFDEDHVAVGVLADAVTGDDVEVYACRVRCAQKYTSYLAIRAAFPDPTCEAGAVSVEVI